MRWAVAFGCGVGLFTFASVFRAVVPPAALAAVGIAAFGLGLTRPRPLYWLVAILGGFAVTLLAITRWSLDPAPYALLPCAFAALHAHLYAATHEVARPGSLLAEVQPRQVLFRASAVVFAISFAVCLGLRSRTYDGALVLISFVAAALLWGGAVRRLGKLLSLAARATRAEAGEAREPSRVIDVGIGDDAFVLDASAGSVYRGVSSSAADLHGDLHALIARLWRHVRVGGVLVALGLVLLVRPGIRFPSSSAPLSRDWGGGHPKPARNLGWFPQEKPVLADVNSDGVDDIVGLRWDWNHEEAALAVVANDGRTFARIWETPSFKSQWASMSTQLARAGEHLYMTDSEGTVRVIHLRTGTILATGAGTRMNEMCVAPEGPARVWVSGETDAYPRGWLFKPDASLTPVDRPPWCVVDVPQCKADEETLCVPVQGPKGLAQEKGFVELSRMAGSAVAVVKQPRDGKESGSVVSFDPRTLAVRWKRPLTLSSEPMHASPSFSFQQDGDKLYVKYQLRSGSWLFGARDLVTGDVLWSQNPPDATAGSHVPSMFAHAKRLYVRVNSQLEVIDGTNGKRLGVAR